jgi:WD40 repeat protein
MACLLAAARNEIQPTEKKGELVRIALRAMATEPDDRYAEVKAFQQALRDYRQHAESIALATQAKEHLAQVQQAQAGAVYRECNEAISGYRQALALWAGNGPAVKGLRRARETLAQRALARGDLALARSEVDAIRAECQEFALEAGTGQESRLQAVPVPAERPPEGGTPDCADQRSRLPEPTALAEQVRAAMGLAARRERVGRLSRIAALAAGCIVIVVSVSAYLITRRQREAAEAARVRAEASEKTAVAAKAQTEQALAETQRENYGNVIALADRKIAAGEIAQAEEMLWNTPKELRGWEWGRCLFLCHQELLTLRGHASEVRSVVFSADGSRLVSSDIAGARVWDVTTGREILSLPSTAYVFCATFSPDGKRVATGHGEGSVVLWDASSGVKLQTLSGHKTCVWAIAFSPDGSRIASSERDEPGLVKDCEVFVWDAATGQRLLALQGHRAGIGSVSFSPDGQRLVTAATEGTVRIWEARTGKELLAIGVPRSYSQNAVFSPDGASVCIGLGDRDLGMWDAATGKKRVTFSGYTGGVTSVVLSVDGARAVTANVDSTARVHDTKTGKELLCIKAQAPVLSAALAPNGRLLATGGADGAIRLWDATREGGTITLAGAAAGFVAGHSRLVTAGWGPIRSWDAATGRRLREVGQLGPVSACALSGDGLRLLTGHEDGKAALWDVQTGTKLLDLVGHAERVQALAFSPDGTRLVSSAGHYAKSGEANTVLVWDAATGQRLFALQGHKKLVWSVCFSPDGQRILTGGGDGKARIWDAANGQEQSVFCPTTPAGNPGGVMAVAFSPDGRRIVTGHWAPVTVIWDVGSGQQLRILTGHTTPLMSVAFSPDGRRVFTTARNSSPRVWDAETGRELLAVQCPNGYPLADVSADGRSLALGVLDVTLILNTLDWGLSREDIGPWKLATYQTWLAENAPAPTP